jgi:predicted nucleotidyltransferase component of viral defense system
MKDLALELSSKAPSHQKKNVLREYLQAHILYSLQTAGGFQYLAFQGGTALRFLYRIRRFSEDLDFSLEKKEKYEPDKIKSQIAKDLIDSGFQVTVHEAKEKTVQKFSFRIPQLLYEAGLSHRENENFRIHLEIDTRPPGGAVVSTTVINRFFLLSLRHHDLATTMAGKLAAILTRKYVKGRDFYDLLWYLTQQIRPEPNLELLNNALHQSGWKGPEISSQNWTTIVWQRIEKYDWRGIVQDVYAFLEDPKEAELLTAETFKKLLHIR